MKKIKMQFMFMIKLFFVNEFICFELINDKLSNNYVLLILSFRSLIKEC